MDGPDTPLTFKCPPPRHMAHGNVIRSYFFLLNNVHKTSVHTHYYFLIRAHYNRNWQLTEFSIHHWFLVCAVLRIMWKNWLLTMLFLPLQSDMFVMWTEARNVSHVCVTGWWLAESENVLLNWKLCLSKRKTKTKKTKTKKIQKTKNK